MTASSIHFVHPVWLLAGLIGACVILVLGLRLDRQRRRVLQMFSARERGRSWTGSRTLRAVKRGLVVVAVMAGFAALARPQWGTRAEEAHRRGIDILFALDTSKSMLAPDLKPDRLTRAKLAIRDLVTKFDGDRVGLVAFAGDAFLQCPLTLDRAMFGQTLDAVDTSLIPRGGTDVGRAVEVSRAALGNQPANQKLLVFLTDGEDLEQHAVDAAEGAAKDGVRIYTVGVGTTGGELIPLPTGGFARDAEGFVHSRLDETTLRKIASVTGGTYRPLGADGRGLDGLYQDVLAKLPREAVASRIAEVPIERYQWPLALAIACFALEPLVRERRARAGRAAEPPRAGKLAFFRRRAATSVAVGLLALVGLMSRAEASPGEAEAAYRAGKFADATAAYERAASRAKGDVKLQFNLGAAAYKNAEYAKADAALKNALHAPVPELRRNAYYDLGNAQFRAGEQVSKTKPQETIDAWKKAIASYESAIKLDGKDADATFNRDLVKLKLAALEQKQKQPDPKDSKQPQSGDQPKPQDQKDQKDQKQSNNKNNKENKSNNNKNESEKPNGNQPAKAGSAGDKDAQAAPGQLSKNDAKALLDALRGDERTVLVAPTGKQSQDPDSPVRKDW